MDKTKTLVVVVLSHVCFSVLSDALCLPLYLDVRLYVRECEPVHMLAPLLG